MSPMHNCSMHEGDPWGHYSWSHLCGQLPPLDFWTPQAWPWPKGHRPGLKLCVYTLIDGSRSKLGIQTATGKQRSRPMMQGGEVAGLASFEVSQNPGCHFKKADTAPGRGQEWHESWHPHSTLPAQCPWCPCPCPCPTHGAWPEPDILEFSPQDLSYKERHWHQGCFRCSQCRGSLVDKPFAAKEEQLLCTDCYSNEYSSRCQECRKTIMPGQWAEGLGGRKTIMPGQWGPVGTRGAPNDICAQHGLGCP